MQTRLQRMSSHWKQFWARPAGWRKNRQDAHAEWYQKNLLFQVMSLHLFIGGDFIKIREFATGVSIYKHVEEFQRTDQVPICQFVWPFRVQGIASERISEFMSRFLISPWSRYSLTSCFCQKWSTNAKIVCSPSWHKWRKRQLHRGSYDVSSAPKLINTHQSSGIVLLRSWAVSSSLRHMLRAN